MNRFDWPRLLAFGLRELRLSPQAFWALTPLEFLIISGHETRGGNAMTRAGLDALIREFPDVEKEIEP